MLFTHAVDGTHVAQGAHGLGGHVLLRRRLKRLERSRQFTHAEADHAHAVERQRQQRRFVGAPGYFHGFLGVLKRQAVLPAPHHRACPHEPHAAQCSVVLQLPGEAVGLV